jgi:hypothetical protein
VEGAEAEWLEMLRNKVKEVGHSADKVFLSFDKDADGELSFDDFKESMDGEQLGLSGKLENAPSVAGSYTNSNPT